IGASVTFEARRYAAEGSLNSWADGEAASRSGHRQTSVPCGDDELGVRHCQRACELDSVSAPERLVPGESSGFCLHVLGELDRAVGVGGADALGRPTWPAWASRSRSPGADTPRMRATGVPRSVTTTSSPAWTRSSHSLRWARSVDTVTSMSPSVQSRPRPVYKYRTARSAGDQTLTYRR